MVIASPPTGNHYCCWPRRHESRPHVSNDSRLRAMTRMRRPARRWLPWEGERGLELHEVTPNQSPVLAGASDGSRSAWYSTSSGVQIGPRVGMGSRRAEWIGDGEQLVVTGCHRRPFIPASSTACATPRLLDVYTRHRNACPPRAVPSITSEVADTGVWAALRTSARRAPRNRRSQASAGSADEIVRRRLRRNCRRDSADDDTRGCRLRREVGVPPVHAQSPSEQHCST